MLPRMELRQLRYFVAVAETGNISRASQCGATRKLAGEGFKRPWPPLIKWMKPRESELMRCSETNRST
jgi:hypothetical protein